jgi:hypothetical protein
MAKPGIVRAHEVQASVGTISVQTAIHTRFRKFHSPQDCDKLKARKTANSQPPSSHLPRGQLRGQSACPRLTRTPWADNSAITWSMSSGVMTGFTSGPTSPAVRSGETLASADAF